MSSEMEAGTTFRERRYAAARKRTAKLTVSQIDDKLNLMECEPVLRDEIVERLARLEACEAAVGRSGTIMEELRLALEDSIQEIEKLRAELRPFAKAYRVMTENNLVRRWEVVVRECCTPQDFARAAEAVGEEKT